MRILTSIVWRSKTGGRGRELKDEPGYLTDLINEHAVDFIERHKLEPFFLYVSHGAPHRPHQARGSKIERGPNKGTLPAWAPNVTYSETPGEDDWLMRHFILPVDEGVGKIRAKLDELGIADNTIIWFISDNGGTAANQTTSKLTKAGKGSMYEGGHRVPGIVWAPGRVKAGTVSDELILGFDIMPTSIALAGVEVPEGHTLDGMNVATAIFKNEALPPLKRFWNKENRGALRDGHWKLVVNGSKNELFDLTADSREKKNLAAQYPERVIEMRRVYDSMLEDTLADSPYPSLDRAEKTKTKKKHL